MEPLEQRSIKFWLLAGFLTLVFLTGGGSRMDIQSLLILRPVAIVFCVIAAYGLLREDIAGHKGLITLFAATFGLVALHLVPLPPAVWQNLPGREIVAEIDQTAGLGQVWRPLSLAPSHTWNALYSLFVPLAVLLLAVQLKRDDKQALVPLLLLFGLLTTLLSVVQLAGDPRGAAYLYDITNPGMAVGFFANRNHQAVFLATLMPMMAALVAGQQQWIRRWVPLLACGAFVLPAILVTGSRAGLIVAAIGAVAAVAVQRRSSWREELGLSSGRRAIPLAIGAVGIASLMAVTIILSRAEALRRLLDDDLTTDLRARTFGLLVDETWRYFPFGTGAGTFDPVYRVVEPQELLSPYYFNHAHNDFLETLLTFGLPGALLLLGAAIWAAQLALRARADKQLEMSHKSYALAGGVTLLLLALGSLADYPLRVPFLMCVLIVAFVMLEEHARGGGHN
ncbi:O-antigen ligase family protein [Erythrobacter sp. GH1-10]|uniref:O-antigen ligase family protein n=1 Tax=Erythrobacter sp. GH1-10 TaxID=3349334 RepID=UPI003877E167